jgi:hypothetical protein
MSLCPVAHKRKRANSAQLLELVEGSVLLGGLIRAGTRHPGARCIGVSCDPGISDVGPLVGNDFAALIDPQS